jgi:hypothetical protein
MDDSEMIFANRITKSWRKQCVGPNMASKNIKIHYGVYLDDVGPFVLVTKENKYTSQNRSMPLPYNRPPSQPKALACTNIKLVFCSFAPL